MRRKESGKKITCGLLAMSLLMTTVVPQSASAYYGIDRENYAKSLAEKYQTDIEAGNLTIESNVIKDGVDTTTEEYQSVIVEFNSLPLITQKSLNNGVTTYSMSDEVRQDHETFERFLSSNAKEKSGTTYTIDFSYYQTFNGVSLKIKGTDIESLLESGVVKAIWKDEVVQVDPVEMEAVEYSIDSESHSRMVSSTPLIGVDKLREEGITGEGVKVGVLDTGVDYNHPDLKDNYRGGYDFVDMDGDPMETTYEDWLASGAEEYEGTSAYYTSHGTHVSGTIAATGSNDESEFAVTGLAPDVDLYVYRVLGPYGSGATSGIIAAIEQSVKDEMDVINLSLGMSSTDSLSPVSVACNNATLAGVVTVVANGNAGPGLSTVGAPGSSALAISVGASSTAISVETFDIELSSGDVLNGRLFGRNFESLDEFVSGEYEIVYGGLGNEYELNDVEGKIVLIDRGELTFVDKDLNAFNAGAAGVIIANNVENQELNLYLGEATNRVPSIAITKEQGDQLKSLLGINTDEADVTEENIDEADATEENIDEADVTEENTDEANVTEENTDEADVTEENSDEADVTEENTDEADVTEENSDEANVTDESDEESSVLEQVTEKPTLKVKFLVTGATTTDPDVLADFSSRGPASDETIKPDIVAPGDGIFSTYPEYVNSPEDGIDYSSAYARISGTSMASPHIAGIAALLLSNNSELKPEEVKVAIMNSAVELDGTYPINAVGAGRVDAYRAVHSEVSITVQDKTASKDANDNLIELSYLTGSLSFDRIYKSDTLTEKTIALQLSNNSNEAKSFNLSVSYLGEDALAQNATTNGVELKVDSKITAAAGKSVDFSASISVPANAGLGRYEGYITLTNDEDSAEVYRVPFSVTYTEPGIKSLELSRHAISNDLEMMHYIKENGISATLEVSSPLSYLEVYVKDYETKERIGLVKIKDLSYIPPGYGDVFYVLNGRAAYFPIDENGEVTYILNCLTDGKYILELVAHSDEFEETFNYEYSFLVDNEDVEITLDKEPGVYELNEDDFTTEEYFGEDYEAFWLHGNVFDNSIPQLQEMGYDASVQDLVVSIFVNGMPQFSTYIDENGDFKIGIEEDDLGYGVYEVSPMPTDEATSQNLFMPPRYFFVKEGTPYTSVTLDKKSMVENENLVSTISVNNLENGSTFEFPLSYVNGFEIRDIRVNQELQQILDENAYTVSIEKKVSGTIARILDLKLSITDKDGNPVNIAGDISLLDVEFKLVDDSAAEFYREYIEARGIRVFDKDGNYANMSYSATYEGVDIHPTTSTIRGVQIAQGFLDASERFNYSEELDQYIWVEDAKGNRYDLEYYDPGMEYLNFDLPVTTEPYQLVTDLPGHFKKAANFFAYREVDGEIIGKTYYLMGSEFYKYALAGDVNKDDVIDILDAIEVVKYYGQTVEDKNMGVDFNFDGIVNADDMDYIIYNYLEINEQNANTKELEQIFNGKTLEDLLVEVGYYDEIRLDSLSISETSLNLELNDLENNTAQLYATMNPESVPNVELVWSSKYDDVATVDQNGLVTAVNPGETIIKVAASDGSVRLYCYVTVTRDGMIPTIESVQSEESVFDVTVGDKVPLEFTLNPNDIVVKEVEFVSSAESIVTVVDKVAVANSEGTAWVTASINSGEAFYTWQINVTAKDEVIPPTGGGDEVTPPTDGGDEVTPPTDGGDEVTPPTDGGDEVTPPSGGGDGVKPPSGGNNGNNPSTGLAGGIALLAIGGVCVVIGVKTRKKKDE